ncbi:uncharacterized protein LOC128333543 isoform X2 [Hemicordylus capensis]|uniref:uncharacterized protein LOC128333543 isoform X2 n=1 Tax=Hemicordylus capensis TaxID=884348 RepID=UPI0023041BA4|nr:uncharacterized protein LOC128333543 isoform X2 [Hemicordylus capensis]
MVPRASGASVESSVWGGGRSSSCTERKHNNKNNTDCGGARRAPATPPPPPQCAGARVGTPPLRRAGAAPSARWKLLLPDSSHVRARAEREGGGGRSPRRKCACPPVSSAPPALGGPVGGAQGVLLRMRWFPERGVWRGGLSRSGVPPVTRRWCPFQDGHGLCAASGTLLWNKAMHANPTPVSNASWVLHTARILVKTGKCRSY